MSRDGSRQSRRPALPSKVRPLIGPGSGENWGAKRPQPRLFSISSVILDDHGLLQECLCRSQSWFVSSNRCSASSLATGVSANAACFSQRRKENASQGKSLVKGSCDLAVRSPDISATSSFESRDRRDSGTTPRGKGDTNGNVRVKVQSRNRKPITRAYRVTQRPKACKQA
jgi:hypothetical protein